MDAIDAEDSGSRHYDTGEIVSLVRILNEVRQSALDRSIGVDDECFSCRRIVECVKQGLIDTRIDHVLSCTTCQENILLFTQTKSNSTADFVSQALKKAGVALEPRSSSDVSAPNKMPAVILGLRGSICYVEDPMAESFSFSCVLIPVLSEGLSIGSLALSGAINSTDACIEEQLETDPDSAARCLRITFKGVRIADRVKRAIVRHQAVIDTIHISFSSVNEEFPQFSTKASMEFVCDKPAPVESAQYNLLSVTKSTAKTMSTFSFRLPDLLRPISFPRLALLSLSSAIAAILVCFFAIPVLLNSHSDPSLPKVTANDKSRHEPQGVAVPDAPTLLTRTEEPSFVKSSGRFRNLGSHKRHHSRAKPKSPENSLPLPTVPMTTAVKQSSEGRNERKTTVADEKPSSGAAGAKYVGGIEHVTSEKEPQKASFTKARSYKGSTPSDETVSTEKAYRNANRHQ